MSRGPRHHDIATHWGDQTQELAGDQTQELAGDQTQALAGDQTQELARTRTLERSKLPWNQLVLPLFLGE